ncbi:MAG: hypothetical protein ACE5NG_19355 [bacterium]
MMIGNVVFAWTSPAGRPIHTDAQSTTLVADTAKSVDVTVPTNKRWLISNIMIHNGDDQARTCYVYIYDSNNVLLAILIADVSLASDGREYWPEEAPPGTNALTVAPLILHAGWYLRFRWGAPGVASAGGTAYYIVNGVEVDM